MSEKPTVCLTFDFDAISLWTARNMTTPGPVSRGEFGAHAIPRILALLRRHDVTSTFFIPGHTIESYPRKTSMVVEAGHEIAAHGYAHEPVSTLSEAEERDVLGRSVSLIQSLTGTPPLGYRTPSFDFTPHTVRLLEEAGFEYDSSLMGTDTVPYFARTNDRCPSDGPFEFGPASSIVELPVSWTLDDYPHLEFVRTNSYVMPGLQDPASMFDMFLRDVQFMLENDANGVCTVTLHPQVIGRGARMIALERFIEAVLDLGVSFSTCADAARSARARLGTM
jgi:peptidoglycan/xylan/chitin deacetylase (PgdA/CDA1 family)